MERPCTPVEEQGPSLSGEMPHDHSQGVEVDFVSNRRGNPDGGDPVGNLPRPIQASTDP